MFLTRSLTTLAHVLQPSWLAAVRTSSSSCSPRAVWHELMCKMMCCQACVPLQGVLQRLASATQPFDFRSRCDDPEVAQHVAEATVNTGTHEQLLRAAVAAIVRPSSRSVCHSLRDAQYTLCCACFFGQCLKAFLVMSLVGICCHSEA